jgi:hypothetical protein
MEEARDFHFSAWLNVTCLSQSLDDEAGCAKRRDYRGFARAPRPGSRDSMIPIPFQLCPAPWDREPRRIGMEAGMGNDEEVAINRRESKSADLEPWNQSRKPSNGCTETPLNLTENAATLGAWNPKTFGAPLVSLPRVPATPRQGASRIWVAVPARHGRISRIRTDMR